MTDVKKNYQWTGINLQGQRMRGMLPAVDQMEAQKELKKIGIEVITLAAKKKSSANQTNIFSAKKKVKSKDILLFTRYLAAMLSAGLPIVQALDIIARDQENHSMQSMVLTIKSNISIGKTLAESFSEFPHQFSDFYCNLIKAGEKSGTLDAVLKRLGNYLEKTEMLKRKIKKALVYPTAILSVAALVSGILLIFVVPQFQTMFQSLGGQLPAFTRMVVDLSNFVQHAWWIVLTVMILLVFWFRHALNTSTHFRELIDNWILKIFIIGSILKKGMIAKYTRTLGTTLEAGLPIVEAMKSIAPIMENSIYKKAIMQVCDDVASGSSLTASMSNTQLFPSMAIQMISVGEAAGSLSEMLNKIAQHYEEEVNAIVDNLSSLLEPIIMLILGVIVGTFVIAMYLPIFKMGSLF